ncbi:MAG: thioredoxin family protein [Deltaproteobacteria bacterium]|nr:thioredoxin family protein [Deltaproteobacteria bacterium]
MVAVNSQMLSLGTKAPEFRLPDTEGRLASISDVLGARGVLVMFISNHCPFVKHVAGELAALGRDYGGQGIAIFAIGSNDVAKYTDDAPSRMREEREMRGYSFPYLYDESQSVAKAYRAACTPDFFLFDGNQKLVYRGQLDDSRPSNGKPVTGVDLRAALDAVIAGQMPSADQRPGIGCNIKWKPGNAPDYFG